MLRKYEEVRCDYERLREICGAYPEDFCGGWCNNERLDQLLESPTKRTAAKLYSSLIDRYFNFGTEPNHNNLDLMNEEVHEIFVRNGNI